MIYQKLINETNETGCVDYEWNGNARLKYFNFRDLKNVKELQAADLIRTAWFI